MQSTINLNCHLAETTIENHTRCLGLVKQLNICDLHKLKEINVTHQSNICDKHFKLNAFDPFTSDKLIITGKEKSIVYNSSNKKDYGLSLTILKVLFYTKKLKLLSYQSNITKIS